MSVVDSTDVDHLDDGQGGAVVVWPSIGAALLQAVQAVQVPVSKHGARGKIPFASSILDVLRAARRYKGEHVA